MPNEKKSWDISKYIKVTVLPDKEFQQNLKAQQRLQQATEKENILFTVRSRKYRSWDTIMMIPSNLSR